MPRTLTRRATYRGPAVEAPVNYLAHLYLSEDTLEARLGNFLGDFAKGEERRRLDPALEAGIALHYRIDLFTDRHPQTKISRQRIDRRFRHLTGVLTDLFYDHFLAKHWADYSAQPLEDFAQEIYRTFQAYPGFMPEIARFVIRRMAAEQRLESYREIEGIESSLVRIAYRLRRPDVIDGAVEELRRHYDGLEADFALFFPELRQAMARPSE